MGWFESLSARLPMSVIKTVSGLQWRHPLLKRTFDRIAQNFQHRDGMISRGAGKGLRFNTAGANAGYLLGTSEPAIQELIARLVHPGWCVFDIGANVGFYAMILARLVGPEGTVVAVEPLAANCQAIAHNVRLNGFAQVRVCEEALGSCDGEQIFQVSSNATWGRLKTAGRLTTVVKEIPVPVRALDSVCRSESFPAPHFVKIDVEGAEVDVLAGAGQTLARARPLLLIELHHTNQAVAGQLEAAAYEVRVVNEVSGGFYPQSTQVRDAYWNAHVLAVPREAASLRDIW